MNSPYPNYVNPVKKTTEQEQEQNKARVEAVKELPILEVLNRYFDEAIKQTDSIDQLRVDTSQPAQDVVSQILALKLLKQHLLRVKGEVKRRIELAGKD